MDWKKLFSRIRFVAGAIIVAVLVAVLIITLVSRISGKTPKIFGISFLRISSSSMEPELKVGDIILIKSASVEQIGVGDIISYHGEKSSYSGKIITHKVVSAPYLNEADGLYYLTTAGIREGAHADPEINETQILGKLVCVVPLIGLVYNFFTTWYGFLTFVIIVLLAFSSELINIIKILRDPNYCNENDREEAKVESQKDGSEKTEDHIDDDQS